MAFTPDGSALYASLYQSDAIIRIDGDGNASIVYGPADGISGPLGSNNIGFRANGDFFVSNLGSEPTPTLLRFPSGGGAAEVWAKNDQILTYGHASLAITASLLYIAPEGTNPILRFTGPHQGAVFDQFAGAVYSLAAHSNGD